MTTPLKVYAYMNAIPCNKIEKLKAITNFIPRCKQSRRQRYVDYTFTYESDVGVLQGYNRPEVNMCPF